MSYAAATTKKDKVAAIRHNLATDARWAVRGLVAIYRNQTEDEKNSQATTEDNGLGFTGSDAYILSSFAEQVAQGRSLSPKQMAIVHKKMPKYARQLLNGIS